MDGGAVSGRAPPYESDDFEGGIGLDGGGVPVRFSHDDPVQLDGDAPGVEPEVGEKLADIQTRGYDSSFAVDFDGDLQSVRLV